MGGGAARHAGETAAAGAPFPAVGAAPDDADRATSIAGPQLAGAGSAAGLPCPW